MGSLFNLRTRYTLYNKMVKIIKVFVILICLTGALSASILAVTPRDKARQLNSIIDRRKDIPELPNGVREFITLKNYLNHNRDERVTLKDMTEAMVSGITTAFLGKSVLYVVQIITHQILTCVCRDFTVYSFYYVLS